MNKGTKEKSQNESVEDEEGFQKVVKRSNRIVRNIPNNAGPRGRGKSSVQDRKQSGGQSSTPVERVNNSRRTVEVGRGNGRPFSGVDNSNNYQGRGRGSSSSSQNRRGRGSNPSFQDRRGRGSSSFQDRRGRGSSSFQDRRGRGSSSSFQDRRGRGSSNISGNFPSRRENIQSEEADNRGFSKSRGSSRGGRGGNRGDRGPGKSGPMNNSRQGRNVMEGAKTSRQIGSRQNNNNNARRVVNETSRGGTGERGRPRASFRGTSLRNERPSREDNERSDKKRFSKNDKKEPRDRKASKQPVHLKQQGPAPNWSDECKHKVTFYLPFNNRYLRAWVDPGHESETPKRNDSGFVKVAFRSSDSELLQTEKDVVVSSEKWTEVSPSGKKIELVRVLLPPNIRSVYEMQQSGEPTPEARKVKKASFVVDSSLVVA